MTCYKVACMAVIIQLWTRLDEPRMANDALLPFLFQSEVVILLFEEKVYIYCFIMWAL